MSTTHDHPASSLAKRGFDDVTNDAAVAIASIRAMAHGEIAEFESIYTTDALNREAATEPPETRTTGPAAFLASAHWLRSAFDELVWEVHETAHDGDIVVLHTTMSGRQTRPFVAYRPDGAIEVAFPPRGRKFAVNQTHWFRMRDGRVCEHWANRDDLGLARQLGWNPPTPLYLFRMVRATRRARRTHRRG